MAGPSQSGEASGGKGGSVSVTLGSAPTSGSLLMVGCVNDGNRTMTIDNSFTDATANGNSPNIQVETWYKISDGTEQTTTVTLVGGGAAAWMFFGEWTEVDYGDKAFQSAVNNTGNFSICTCGSDGDADTTLNIAFVGQEGSATFSSPSSGYQINDQGTGGPAYACFSNETGASSSTPTITSSASAKYVGCHLTFKDASSGQQILTLRANGY